MKRISFFAGLIALTLLVSMVAVPTPAQAQSTPKMVFIPAQAPQGEDSTVVFQIAGFAANEPVTIWQTYPDYTVNPIGTYAVNAAGIFRKDLVIDGDQPVGMHHFTARGNTSGIVVMAPFEVLPAVVDVTTGVSIEVTAGQGNTQGASFNFVGSGYQGREAISVWLTLPDGTVQYIGTKRSNEGSWSIELSFDETDPVGQYHLTGFGNTSQRTGVATFIVTGGNFTDAAGGATLEAYPTHTRQLETVELYGSGFAPGEEVSIWITMADGTVWNARKVIALDGTFAEAGYMPALIPDNGFPIGTTVFTAYGNTSKLVATATVELYAGSGF